MKVCYIISTPSVAGGANRSLLDMIRQLMIDEKDFSCFAVMSGHGTMEEELQKMGIKCYVLTFANGVKSRKAWRTLGKKAYNLYAGKQLEKIFREEKPDVVHNNSLPTTIGMEVALRRKIPYVCHIRENVWDGLGMDFYAPRTVRKVMSRASCVVAISKYIRKSYVGFYKNKNTVVLNDGIVIDDYCLPKRKIFKDDSTNILIVGVINPQKGQADAVRAVEILGERGRNVCLTILGLAGRWQESTAYADDLKTYVEDHHMTNVQFMDPINDVNELKELRSHYDINLICSSAEGLGRTTIESMLSGALTVAANAGATPEIIKDKKTGLLYNSGNVEEIADCIEWAIENKEKAEEIALQGQNTAIKKYSIRNYAQSIMDIYRNIQLGQ